MYTLFRNRPDRMGTSYSFPELLYLRRQYPIQVKDLKTYYRHSPVFVNGSNTLGNILRHIDPQLRKDDFSAASNAEDKADALVKAFGFVSSISRGRVQSNVVLGPMAKEIVIATYEPFDLLETKRFWRELTPLRFLYHSRYDTNLPVLHNQFSDSDFAVMALNIPMLVVQYRNWLNWQLENNDQNQTLQQFIGGYVLPNAIDSYLDIAYFNRLAATLGGTGVPKDQRVHPVYTMDLESRVDGLVRSVLKQTLGTADSIEGLAWVTPGILKASLFEIADLPNDPITRQNEWAMALARLPYILYLIQQLKASNNDPDANQINDVRLAVQQAGWDNVASTISDPWIAKRFKDQCAAVLALTE